MEGNRGTKPRNKIENEGTLFKCDIYFKINPRKYKKHQFFFCISLWHFCWGRRLISLQFDWFLVFLIKFHNDPQFYQKKNWDTHQIMNKIAKCSRNYKADHNSYMQTAYNTVLHHKKPWRKNNNRSNDIEYIWKIV